MAKTTITSMRAGLVYGTIGQAEYIIDKFREESGYQNMKVVATGGLGRIISEGTDKIDIYDSELTLQGMRLIYERTKKVKMGSNKLKIGNVSLDGNIVLAPMAGVTDLPFRLLCKRAGADLICTEMVSAKGIFYNNKNTEDLLRIDDRERPVSLQLFGSDPDIISEMAKKSSIGISIY